MPHLTTCQCVCVAFTNIVTNVCFRTTVIMSVSFGMTVAITCSGLGMVALGIFRLTRAATSGLCVLTTFRFNGLSSLSSFFFRCSRSHRFFGIHCASFSGFRSFNSSFLYRGNGFRGGLCSSNAECTEQGNNGQELLHVIGFDFG